MAKINITIADELLEKIERVATANYTTKSGLISAACASYIRQQELLFAVQDGLAAISKIADLQIVSEEDMAQLEEFERTIKRSMA